MKSIAIFIIFIIHASATAQDLDPGSFPSSFSRQINKTLDIKESAIVESGLSRDEKTGIRFFEIVDAENKKTGYFYRGRVFTCRSGGCDGMSNVNDGRSEMNGSEYFDYYIIFDAAARVRAVRIYNYMASHGHEVTSPGWLKQFDGYDGSINLVPGKNIDSISGATISTYSLAVDVQRITRILNTETEN